MAEILCDKELKQILNKIIIDGVEENIKPNSYVLRCGKQGEFINTNKEFEFSSKKKGIIVQPGHSVGLSSFEKIDFRRDTVQKIFPECDLHAILSPATDLSREGIVAPTTQVDAGFCGSLNWTLTNTSNLDRRFLFKENIYRLTIFKLYKSESPENLYNGSYQLQEGYSRSRRKGAPVGMRDDEWIDPNKNDSPAKIIDNLINSGYPWNILGQKLKIIDDQFKSVTEEYSNISDQINKLNSEIKDISATYKELANSIPKIVRENLRDEATVLQNRWLIGSGTLIVALIGIILTILSNKSATIFFKANGTWIGFILIIISIIVLYLSTKRRDKK